MKSVEKLRVLSCFDGISCGRVALEKLGIPVEEYYASEIDKFPEAISAKNYPDIKRLGDINGWESWDLPQIDLLMGGFSCQSFSFAGKQLNFDDPRGKLFWVLAKIFKHYKPKWFLFENVMMKQEYQDIISQEIGVEPILINSNRFSAQSRKRLFWTNIPIGELPPQSDLTIEDILEEVKNPKLYSVSELFKDKGFSSEGLCHIAEADIKANQSTKRVYSIKGKCPTLTTMGGGHREPKILVSDDYWRKLTPLECERLQCLPDGYTEGFSNSARYKALGNGWTVDVIAFILAGLK